MTNVINTVKRFTSSPFGIALGLPMLAGGMMSLAIGIDQAVPHVNLNDIILIVLGTFLAIVGGVFLNWAFDSMP